MKMEGEACGASLGTHPILLSSPSSPLSNNPLPQRLSFRNSELTLPKADGDSLMAVERMARRGWEGC